jgi:hypothetical protein
MKRTTRRSGHGRYFLYDDPSVHFQVVGNRDSDPVGISKDVVRRLRRQSTKMGELHSSLAKAAFKPAEQAIAAMQGT